MKTKFFVLPILIGILLVSGCSSTWEGAKKDTSDAWRKTKKTINEATTD